MQSFHEEFWVNPTPPTLATPFAATLRQNASVPSMTFGHLTHTLSSNTVWDVRVGRFCYNRDDESSTGDRTTPNRFDRITGISSGNVPQMGGLTLNRMTAKAVLNRYQPAMLGGDHQLRVGTEVERGEHHQPAVIPGGVRYIDSSGAPFQAVYRAPSIDGGRFDTAARVRQRLRHRRKIAYRECRRAFRPQRRHQSRCSGARCRRIRDRRHRPRPRDAVHVERAVAAPGHDGQAHADGRTMLRASYGRFNQGVLTGELGPIHPGVTPTTTMAFNAATGGYTRLVSVVDPRINLALDPNTRTPHTDQYSIGLDREIAPRLAAAAAYIRKTGATSSPGPTWAASIAKRRGRWPTVASCRCSCLRTRLPPGASC